MSTKDVGVDALVRRLLAAADPEDGPSSEDCHLLREAAHALELAAELLRAVRSTSFEGIVCEDVKSGNWFDARRSLLQTK